MFIFYLNIRYLNGCKHFICSGILMYYLRYNLTLLNVTCYTP